MIDERPILKQIRQFKRSVKSENSDYLTGYICALSAVEGMIASQPQIGTWIPCSERLPGKYELCLITQRIGSQLVRKTALYIIGEWKYNGRTLRNDSVIAWMPLPEPYKEEK